MSSHLWFEVLGFVVSVGQLLNLLSMIKIQKIAVHVTVWQVVLQGTNCLADE